MNDIGKVDSVDLVIAELRKENYRGDQFGEWADRLSALQSTGNVCQGLTDAQWFSLWNAMSSGLSISEGISASIAKAARAYLAALPAGDGWRTIESAPKDMDKFDITPSIILGYAPDEENYSPESKEGYWSVMQNRWAWASDPQYDCPQPTHWQPLPPQPKGDRDE